MVVNESMYQLGSVRSAIRELFEYGKKRAAIVGKEKVDSYTLIKTEVFVILCTGSITLNISFRNIIIPTKRR